MANTSTNIRKSINLLPTYFQTDKNSKFLSSTLDQLFKVPSLTRINGFVGNKLSVTYNPDTDVYISDSNAGSPELRQKYQLEPALTMSDVHSNITNAYGFDDLVNQIGVYGGIVNNYNKLFTPEVNAYDPHIEWDKFVNFRQYYWLPMGPDAITVAGLQRDTISTYTVTDSADGKFFVFTPDGVTEDPLITLYKGVTYVFNVTSAYKFYIKTTNDPGPAGELTSVDGVLGNGTKNGQIIFTVLDTSPTVLYYTSDNNQTVPGTMLVKSIVENSSLDVEAEILGKAQYKTATGVEFINGLKVKFAGNVTPSLYVDKEFIVEGVGTAIKLVDFNTLTTPDSIATLIDANFDATGFDDYPFDNFKNLPITPEYVTINRSSADLNPWTRYNRWFHADVITTSAIANGIIPILPLTGRASRPIIEFEPNIQLYNFGAVSIPPVDIMDQETTDAFSFIEGTVSHTVDGIVLEPGQRIIFNADNDPLVHGKVFEITLSSINGKYKLDLVEQLTPSVGDGVIITQGLKGQGTEWWYNGTDWVHAQQRTTLNQAPLFDVFDNAGHSYSDSTYYNSIFSGNEIFGYMVGTGVVDPVLGFPLSYQNVGVEGSYLFENYFNTGALSVLGQNSVTNVPIAKTFLRINNSSLGASYVNVWTKGKPYQLAVQQFQVMPAGTTAIPVTVFDNPALITDLTVSVFLNNVKLAAGTYTFTKNKTALSITLAAALTKTTKVLFKFYTSATPNASGTYETPLNLTNNPLNGPIEQFTLSELSDHVQTMVDRVPGFTGVFPGASNLKSLPAISQYGTRLISNNNPLSFAQTFITDVEHSLVNAVRSTANDYYQFKLQLIKTISQADGDLLPANVLDQAISEIIKNKNSTFSYGQSDMLGYGNNNVTGTHTVTDSRNVSYPLLSIFDITQLSTRAVLVYLNGNILIHGLDYVFDTINPNVTILTTLAKGDVIEIKDYVTTVGSYIPPTPTKLGLYPSYEPKIYKDDSYATTSVMVIQGHDGSLAVAYTTVANAALGDYDFRDLALLEYETRVYNNLKTPYNPDLINIDDVLPGVFRTNDYTYSQLYSLVEGDFVKWAGIYGVDFSTNTAYDVNNHKTYNFKSSTDYLFNSIVPGNWRGIYKYYFDTDRPNTCPWEMLGFSVEPTWWQTEYGPAPYTAGNLNLWQDLEAGIIRQGSRAGTDATYARPGLSQIIPVDDSGNVIDVRQWASMSQNGQITNPDQDWAFGDCGPAETTWRRSSLWPFAVQLILALSKPADYAAKMFDPSRLIKDVTGQYKYGANSEFLNPATVSLYTDVDSSGNTILAAGYGVWVIENGKKRASTYLTSLKQNLSSVNFNLFYKTGGFLSKDKLELIIDSVSPNTVDPGVLLPNEDYTLFFNVSNPIKAVAISGIIIEKRSAQFIVKGYDKQNPFFTINAPVHRTNDTAITVGGKSAPYVRWTANTFYQAGQVIQNDGKFYTVKSSLNSGTIFDAVNYIRIAQLPITGGAAVLSTLQYDREDTVIPYGTHYNTLQEVYDLIVGYGAWLKNQGFIFNQYNNQLGTVIDWQFSGKEFLYWSTQNWANGSVITLSPFSNQIQYKFSDAVVDNVLDSFYDYSLLKASGQPFPHQNFSLNRESNVCTISTKNTAEGLYFARLNLVQKEHTIVMKNSSMFGDVIYDIETGYRQSRIKLAGFITGEWNGDFLSPGFVYDEALISGWQSYTDYSIADVVKFSGSYYSANENIPGTATFDFTKWNLLGSAPVAQLLPNFDYKINQFEDFYSLDIDNFDAGQQKMAQHLVGYTPRTYLTNIFVDPIAQYKFYQGFIKEKGTANAITKLSKASIHNLQGQIEFDEEWAFRIGAYGNYVSYNEVEFPLREADFIENSQVVKFVDAAPTLANDIVSYIVPTDITLPNATYTSNAVFDTLTSATYANNNLLLPTAGYVRTDDITATAYNNKSLLDIANNGAINEGDTIWLGFKDNGDWDVYRYTVQTAKVISTTITSPATELTFNTDVFHGLSVGDIVSVRGLDNGTDGVYTVSRIPTLTSFSVSSVLTQTAKSHTSALLYKFVSVRVNEFDDISNLQNFVKFKTGDMIWADRGAGATDWSTWAVYQNINNYSSSTAVPSGSQILNQQYGFKIATQYTANTVAISAPAFVSASEGQGRIFVFGVDNTQQVTTLANFGVHNSLYHNTVTNFGHSLAYDEMYDIVVAGAPDISLIQISGINRTLGGSTFLMEDASTTATNAMYGNNLFISKTTSTALGKVLLISAPGINTVYAHSLTVNTNTAVMADAGTIYIASTSTDMPITGNTDGSRIAIASPDSGNVTVYTNTGSGYVLAQTLVIPSIYKTTENFGYAIEMTDDGNYLFVSSTTVPDAKFGPGKVFVHSWVSTLTQYVLSQTLNNPSNNSKMYFGEAIKVDPANEALVVSSIGKQTSPITIDAGNTTFDGGSTQFVGVSEDSGSVYVFERFNTKFVYAHELIDSASGNVMSSVSLPRNNYGKSLAINAAGVFVGAPLLYNYGSVYKFTELDPTTDCWNVYRQQDALVDITKINRAITIDTVKDDIVDYLDIIDPVKGRIAGLADQEIRYKTAFDPAVYSVGTQAVVVDTNTSWIEAHVGELWWDLSTVKYVWYEQSDLEYRKNSWGSLFPGTSIDVYEWVKSEYLPSQWSALADTADGLSQGISGQPKYADNSIISVKQYYNASTGAVTNVYFYWVKNTVILPNVSNRRMSASAVASLIYNPASYGSKFISIIDSNAIAVTNVKNTLVSNNIYLNISKDDIKIDVNKHTEWILLGEGNATDMPTPMLNKKLMDSLVGKDSLGNIVPDPTLSTRAKYGVGLRPRQSMFVNRTEALRNAIEYANEIAAQYLISDIANFARLNSKDEIPDIYSREYDLIVESYDDLTVLVTPGLVQATATCNIDSSGVISSVTIVNAGQGYGTLLATRFDSSGTAYAWAGPTVSIDGDANTAIITTEVNSLGAVVYTTIVNAGSGFLTAPTLEIRPYTVIVQVDTNSNNRWAKYILSNNSWVKIYTQVFDTTQYWNYVNWTSSDYDPLKPLVATISETYLLDTLAVNAGDYVKVNNQGNGKYIILQKVASGGTFDSSYNLVCSEKGTIAFSDSLWNTVNNHYNYDYYFTYDQTSYDQTPEIELVNILTAIKDDIFVGPMQIYWNYFFFKAVKYAMSEQKFLDWAFKTSFINVRNLAGSLDQRPVYKFQNSKYYEDYIMEVKPYHTKIRNYQVNYDALDPSQTYTTDFDLPAFYNQLTKEFTTVNIGDSLLNSYPWKGWSDNYTFTIESITVEFAGSGYTAVPTVQIIHALGDTGVQATAEALISLGKVTSITVTNPGSGYTKAPKVLITGGGSTTLTPARAYAVLTNGKVRTNFIEMKFDRVSPRREISTSTITDSFICNGNTNEFALSWAADKKKADIDITVAGVRVLATDYSIVNYKKLSNGYQKLFSNLVLDTTPAYGSILTIKYHKNIDLYYAVDRIEDFYSPTEGMPGKDPAQLMSGIDFPGAQIQGLPFDYSTNWDITPFGQSLFGDDSNYYTTATVVTTATIGTTTLVLNSVAGIQTGLRVNTVALNTTTVNDNKFNATVVTVVQVDTTASSVTFSTSTAEIINAGTVMLEFWDFNMTPGILDTVLDGGDLGYTLATGINPEDIIVNADTFISPNVSYAPEELVKGELHESLGVSVFTRIASGSPLISQSISEVTQTTASTVVKLMMLPPSEAAIMVSFNNNVMTYGTDYTVDFNNQTMTVNTQPVTGELGITIVSIGGIGYISSDYSTVSNTTTAKVHVGAISEIGSIYATLNGVALTPSQYILGVVGTEGTQGELTVTGLSTTVTNTLQAWAFLQNNNSYSEIKEQKFVGDGVSTDYLLTTYPGNLGPANAQAIVEINNRRLTPPNTTYYSVAAGVTTFAIDPYNTHLPGIFDLASLEVYVNGIQLRNGIDFILDQPNNAIQFASGFLQTGDVMAINNHVYSDYYFADGRIYIKASANYQYNDVLKVITFTDADGSLIRTETFQARSSRRYPISRTLLNQNYLWVTVDGQPLINGYDYYVDSDNQTVVLRDTYPFVDGSTVIVMSMTDITDTNAIGYRVFTDLLNRTQYKRLSKNNGTQLAEPLYATSTYITVQDSVALPVPNPALKIPGAILIGGERVEYTIIDGNILRNVKRATLGTGARDVYPVGTRVTDQGVNQNLPYGETFTTVHITATNTTSYIITGITFDNAVAYKDQVMVYYGGTPLKKAGMYHQDITVAFDNAVDPQDIRGTTSTVSSLPPTTILGESYLVTATNQVWVYTASNGTGTNYSNGYVYSGLNYTPPEFTIVNTSGYHLSLSIATVTTGANITIVQRTARNNLYASTVTSLINDSGIVASFLRAEQAALPDKYYYGQI
jgi:hypothetical protein